MAEGWKFVNAVDEFSSYRENWQCLCKETASNHPLLQVDFVEPLIKYFAPNNLLLGLKGISGQDGMALLHQKYVGVWETFAPGPAPLSLAMLRTKAGEAINSSISSMVKSLPGYAILIGFYRLDPDLLTVKMLKNNGHTETLPYIDTIRIPIDIPFNEYWDQRSRNLKRDIVKKFRRIEQQGIHLDFRELRQPEEMCTGVKIYGGLESSGWKGEADTSVHINNCRGRFYAKMLERFARRQAASIYQLLFDGQVVASMLAIRGSGMAILLKTTYDEGMARFSPGWLMMYEIHKKLFSSQDVVAIEHYGNATQKLRQWGGNVRTIYHLNYYRWPLVKKLKEIARRVYLPA